MRAEPGLFGSVASDPMLSRLVDTLARDCDTALAAITGARVHLRLAALAPWAEVIVTGFHRLHGPPRMT